MRALQFITDLVTFKLRYNQIYQMKTPYSPFIHILDTRSKWNMDEIFGLKLSFIMCTHATIFFQIPPCAHHVIFATEFKFLGKIFTFMHMQEFQNKLF